MPVGDRPLHGVGVVVTRAEGSDGPLSRSLTARSARVLRWPTVRHAPPADARPLLAGLGRLARFDWLILTSPRAVEALAGRLDAVPPALRVAVVGEATAAAAVEAGLRVDLVPARQSAEGLVEALGAAGVGSGTQLLFPASDIARPVLEEGLGRLGAEVVRVTAYRTLPATVDREECRRALSAGEVQVIVFTSPSAVDGLRVGLGPELFTSAADQAAMAVIGPTTAEAVRAAGGARIIESPAPSFDALADAVVRWVEMEGARGAG